MPVAISAAHIAAAGGAFEPQRQSNFMLHLEAPGGGGGNRNALQLSLQAFPFPKYEIAVGITRYMNEERKWASNATFQNLQATFKDYVDTATASILASWSRLVFNPDTGAIGLASEYKSQGFVQLFAPNGTGIRSWKLIGVWPSNFNFGEGNMEGQATQNLIQVTFAIDQMVPENLGAVA